MQVSAHSPAVPAQAQQAVSAQARTNESVQQQAEHAVLMSEHAEPAKATSGEVGTQLHVVG